METLSLLFFLIASAIHLFIFVMESVIWGSKFSNKVFKVTQQDSLTLKLFAFNQGFYNLFLAVEVLIGLYLYLFTTQKAEGIYLAFFGAASMIGAAVVLLYSAPHLKRAFVIQGLPPLLGFIFAGALHLKILNV